MLRTVLSEYSGQESLVIEHLHITDGEHVCRYFGENSKSLQILRLRNCRIERDAFVQILRHLDSEIEELRILDLSYTNVQPIFLELLRLVKFTDTLRELHLTGSGLSTAGEAGKSIADGLAGVIADHASLEKISLEKNECSVQVGRVFIEAAQRNPRLKDLRLAGTGVGISNLTRLDDILRGKILNQYPQLATMPPMTDRSSGVFTPEVIVEWLTLRRVKFSEQRHLLALRYEASILHDEWSAEESRANFLAVRKAFLADEQEVFQTITQKVENMRMNLFPRHKQALDRLYKEEALAAIRLHAIDQAKAIEAAEEAVKEAKKKQREQLRMQEADQERTIDWVIEQELNAIIAVDREIADIKQRILKKREIKSFLLSN